MHRVCVQAHRPSSHSLTLSLLCQSFDLSSHTDEDLRRGEERRARRKSRNRLEFSFKLASFRAVSDAVNLRFN